MWLPSAHLRYIAPDTLSRRVGTKFDGKRLVSSDAAARDLKVQLSGSHAERLLDKITDLPDYGLPSASATSKSTSTTRTWDRCASQSGAGARSRPRRAVHPPCPVRPDSHQPLRPPRGINRGAVPRIHPARPWQTASSCKTATRAAHRLPECRSGSASPGQFPTSAHSARSYSAHAPRSGCGASPPSPRMRPSVEAVDLHVGSGLKLNSATTGCASTCT